MAVRTCVACRKADDKSALLRFVVTKGDEAPSLVFDAEQRYEGRGAYLHLACVNASVVTALVRSLMRMRARTKLRTLDIDAVLREGIDRVRSRKRQQDLREQLRVVQQRGVSNTRRTATKIRL